MSNTPKENNAMKLFMEYNQVQKDDCKTNNISKKQIQWSEQRKNIASTITDPTVQAMVQMLVKNKQRIPLEILRLNDFYNYGTYNNVQSQCVIPLMFTDENILVSAPTASGKTVIMEMAILRELAIRNEAFKILYLAPIRALCQQKVEEWAVKYSRFNVKVSELTGDNDFTQKKDNQCLNGPHIIVATPEKWDYYIRRQKNVAPALSSYTLLLIDEVHCVGDEERGPRLETIITRLKTFVKLYKQKLRLRTVAVSATLPNIEDIAVWLEVKKDSGLLTFKESDRTVPLEKHVLVYKCENAYSFEGYLNSMLYKVIEKYSDGKPTLVFCQTQKGTQTACTALLQDSKANQYIKDEVQAERLMKIAQTVQDKQLANFIKQGVAYHNANLNQQDRSIVERLFLAQDILIICTTTTLALGVNLPARLVVIKSTLCYKGTKLSYQEYSLYELCQMMGRAGRPQFDDKGVVAIMTDIKNQNYYKDLFEKSGTESIQSAPDLESHLGSSIPTLINAEVGIGYISTLDAIISFIKNSYYYIRQLAAGKYLYNNGQELLNEVDQFILLKCQEAINNLNELKMIRYDSKALTMESTEFGKEVAKQNIMFGTVEKFKNNYYAYNKEQSGLVQLILVAICSSEEFEVFKSKNGERRELTRLNKIVKWKIKGAISSFSKKIFVLLQSHIQNFNLDWELKKQMSDIISLTERILSCIKKLFQTNEDGLGFISSVLLLSYITKKTWPDEPKSCLQQLNGLGEKLSQELINKGIKNFDQIALQTPATLSEIISRNTTYADTILSQVKARPSILQIKVDSQNNGFDLLIQFRLDFQNHQECTIILISGSRLIFQKPLQQNQIKQRIRNEPNDVFFSYKLYIINHDLVGANEVYQIQLRSFQGETFIIESKNIQNEEIYLQQQNIDFDNYFIPKVEQQKSNNQGKDKNMDQYLVQIPQKKEITKNPQKQFKSEQYNTSPQFQLEKAYYKQKETHPCPQTESRKFSQWLHQNHAQSLSSVYQIEEQDLLQNNLVEESQDKNDYHQIINDLGPDFKLPNQVLMMGDSILEIITDNKHDSSVWSEAEEICRIKKRKRIQIPQDDVEFNKKLCLPNNNQKQQKNPINNQINQQKVEVLTQDLNQINQQIYNQEQFQAKIPFGNRQNPRAIKTSYQDKLILQQDYNNQQQQFLKYQIDSHILQNKNAFCQISDNKINNQLDNPMIKQINEKFQNRYQYQSEKHPLNIQQLYDYTNDQSEEEIPYDEFDQVFQQQFRNKQLTEVLDQRMNQKKDLKYNKFTSEKQLKENIKPQNNYQSSNLKYQSERNLINEAQRRSSDFLANLTIQNKQTTEQKIKIEIKPLTREVQCKNNPVLQKKLPENQPNQSGNYQDISEALDDLFIEKQPRNDQMRYQQIYQNDKPYSIYNNQRLYQTPDHQEQFSYWKQNQYYYSPFEYNQYPQENIPLSGQQCKFDYFNYPHRQQNFNQFNQGYEYNPYLQLQQQQLEMHRKAQIMNNNALFDPYLQHYNPLVLQDYLLQQRPIQYTQKQMNPQLQYEEKNIQHDQQKNKIQNNFSSEQRDNSKNFSCLDDNQFGKNKKIVRKY